MPASRVAARRKEYISRQGHLWLKFAFLPLYLAAAFAFAQLNSAYNPPSGYYSGTEELSGEALKTALHEKIRIHFIIPYTSSSTDVWDAFRVLDEDPVNSTNVILLYTGVSRPCEDSLSAAPYKMRLYSASSPSGRKV